MAPLPTTPWPAFRALAQCFIPETLRAGDAEWTAMAGVVQRALAARPPRVRRQILLFIRLLDLTARVTRGRGLERLSLSQRTSLLESVARSRLLLLRRGVWGLRTLVMMGWYTNPEVIAALGYRANPAGWEARR